MQQYRFRQYFDLCFLSTSGAKQPISHKCHPFICFLDISDTTNKLSLGNRLLKIGVHAKSQEVIADNIRIKQLYNIICIKGIKSQKKIIIRVLCDVLRIFTLYLQLLYPYMLAILL